MIPGIFKRRWRSLGYGLALVVVFLLAAVVAFSLAFPAEALRPLLAGIATRNGVQLTVATLDTTFPPGLVGRQITLSSTSLPELPVERLRLRPCWGALLRGETAVCFAADLLGGTLSGEVARSGRFAVTGRNIAWKGKVPQAAGMTLAATLLQGSVSGLWPPQEGSNLVLEVQFAGVEAGGILGSQAPLPLGNVTVRGTGQGKNFSITTLEASGGGLGVTGDGSLLLNPRLPLSPLKLNLALRPAPELHPTWSTLLTALVPPGADGVCRLRLGGTLARPKKS